MLQLLEAAKLTLKVVSNLSQEATKGVLPSFLMGPLAAPYCLMLWYVEGTRLSKNNSGALNSLSNMQQHCFSLGF